MHTIEEVGSNVAAFLIKLWKLVEDPETSDLIAWNPAGTSFYIRNQAKFSHELLPLYFKHNNMASFIRQLNMYGFHKITSLEGGGLKPDKDEMEFAHQCFLMGHPYLLEHIKRKVPVSKALEELGVAGEVKPELMKKVLNEVKGLKGKQESVSSQLSEMKRENEVLWREVAVLRQKHHKQQQIVNKLIQFLVSMVHTSRSGGISMKRHYPIMLKNVPHSSSKKRKHNVEDVSNLSPGGPVIHELDPSDILDVTLEADSVVEEQAVAADEVQVEEETEVGDASPALSTDSMNDLERAVNTSSPEVLLELAEECSLPSPSPNTEDLTELPESEPVLCDDNAQDGKGNMAIARTDSTGGITEDLDLHLDSMDSELDSLKELLKGEGYSLDANTLFGLFSEDPYAFELPMPLEPDAEGKPSGSELIAYNSSADLADMLDAAESEWLLPAADKEATSKDATC